MKNCMMVKGNIRSTFTKIFGTIIVQHIYSIESKDQTIHHLSHYHCIKCKTSGDTKNTQSSATLGLRESMHQETSRS